MENDSKEIVRRFYEHIVSDNLLDQIADYVSEDCIAGNGDHIGADGMRKHLKAVRNTYPDYRMRILRQFENNGFVISEFIMEGTFMNEWMGIKPTGKRLSISGINIDRIANGKITEHSGYANTFEALMENNLIRPNS